LLTTIFDQHISQLTMVKRNGRADGPDFNILALDDQVHPQPPTQHAAATAVSIPPDGRRSDACEGSSDI
jgi:hypothetical protein